MDDPKKNDGNDLHGDVRKLVEAVETLIRGNATLAVQEHFSVEEFAKLVGNGKGKAPFTVRQWCLHRRINATKANDGRTWVIPRSELDRYHKEGLLPVQWS